MPLSPVIEAFLQGRQQQIGLINDVSNRQLQKEHIDAIVKNLQAEQQNSQKKLELEQQIFNLNHQKALGETTQQLIENLRKNPEMAPGTTNFQQPATQMLDTGGNIINGTSQVTPQPGTPISMNSAMGPISLNMPKSDRQQAFEQAQTMIPILKAQAGAKAEGELPSKLKEIEANNNDKLNQLTERIRANELIASDRNASQERIHEAENNLGYLKAQLGAYEAFAKAGIPLNWTPDQQKQAVDELQENFKLGRQDPDKTNPLHKQALNQLTQEGYVPLTTKIANDVNAKSSSVNRLLSDYANVDNKYPAQSFGLGRIGSTIAANAPIFKGQTDIGQTFDLLNKNIAALASTTGESPSMARSVALAKKAETAKIAVNDTPEIRKSKMVGISDLGLERIQDSLGNLPQKQRIEVWQNLLQNNPLMQSIKTDARFGPALSNILKTGTYDSNLLNASK